MINVPRMHTKIHIVSIRVLIEMQQMKLTLPIE